jgi:hypothetical protein
VMLFQMCMPQLRIAFMRNYRMYSINSLVHMTILLGDLNAYVKEIICFQTNNWEGEFTSN